MRGSQDAGTELRCSFCGKTQPEARKIVAGNKGVAICNECVETCNDILADTSGRPSSSDEYEPIGQPELMSFRCPACGHQWAMGRK